MPSHVDAAALRASTYEALSQFADTEHAELATSFASFVDDYENAHSRECDAGHITTGCLIVDSHAGKVLLTLHPKVGLWLQTGGHVEPEDRSLPTAALREAVEESGISDLSLDPVPVRLDRHPIRCGGRLLDHLDVAYVAYAPRDSTAVMSDESDDLAWFSFDRLPDETDQTVRRLVRSATARAYARAAGSRD